MRKLLLGLALNLLTTIGFAQQVTTPPIVALACAYNSGTQTGTSGQFMFVQCDVNGKLVTSGSAPTGAAGGSLKGTYPNPGLADVNTIATSLAIGGGSPITSSGPGGVLATAAFAAGYSNTATPFNTAFGSAAGNPGVITGVDNSALGYQAGKAITSGTDNTFLGFQAGNTVATGANNIAIGSKALAFSSNGGSQNIAIGKFAMTGAVTGSNNVAIGNQPLASLTSGSNHIAIGLNALNSITTSAQGHVAIGQQALNALTTGNGTVAIGNGAGQVLTTGGQNVILGFQALRNAVDATNTVAIGYNALFSYVSGATFNQNSIAIGTSALFAMANGSENVAIGTSAMGVATDGTLNVAVGIQAMQASTTSSNNTAIGTSALSVLTTGSRNVGIGVAVASLVDGNDLTTGSNNTLIGTGAKFGSSTQRSYATVIGADAIGVLFDNSITLGRVSGGTIDTTYVGTLVTATTDATTSTGGALQVPGGASIAKRVWMPAITSSAGLQTAVLCQSSGGEVIADSVACLASSERFKEDIITSDMGLATVLALRPITYRYRATGNDRFDNAPNQRDIHAGFSAEQAALVDPRLVAYDLSGNIRTIRPDAVPAALVRAVQELKADNDNLRFQIEALKQAVR